jgi:hypothetical protein
MSQSESPIQSAEAHLWDYLRRQLEAAGNGDAAEHLKHFLMAKAGEPVVRGDLVLVPFEMLHRVSDYTAKLNAVDGSVMAWHFDLLAEQPGRDLPDAEALDAATKAAQPPPGAKLAKSGYEEMDGQPLFAARWEHEADGIPVEKDFIHVQVNGRTGHAFALNRRWHAPSSQPSER